MLMSPWKSAMLDCDIQYQCVMRTLTNTTVAKPSKMKSHLQGANRPTPCMPERIPAEIRPAKAFESRIPQTSSAILTPSSRLVYQQLSRYMAPGKNGASMMPRKNRTVRRPAGELVAAVQALTIAQAMIHIGCRRQFGTKVGGR